MASKQGKFAFIEPVETKFGGSLLKNSNPKGARPVDTKAPMHLVFHSDKATGDKSFLRFDKAIWKIISDQSHLHRVKVYSFANAGNHLHMLIRGKSRRGILRFIRGLGALIARRVLRAARGAPSQEAGSFWSQRPYSRILASWVRDFRNVCAYLKLNRLEVQKDFRSNFANHILERGGAYGPAERRKLTDWLRREIWA